jgi:hypothetical protein
MQSYDATNQQLNELLDAARGCLQLPHTLGGRAFRNLTEHLYRFIHGGSFTKVEPDGWVSTDCLGLHRKDLIAEHKEPLSQVFKSLHKTTLSNAELYDVIVDRIRFVHVTKKQDQDLKTAGFNHKRPDPAAAYAGVGIIEVYLPQWDRKKPISF